MHATRWPSALAVVVILLAGCQVQVAATPDEATWHEDTDRALGAAVSALGTARTVLEQQQLDRLPQPFIDVAVRDLSRTLDTETASYRTTQPPPPRTEDNATVIAALDEAETILNSVVTAASADDAGEQERALAEVRAMYDEVARLQERLAHP